MKQREMVSNLAHAIEAKNEAAAQSLAAQILEQQPTLFEVLFISENFGSLQEQAWEKLKEWPLDDFYLIRFCRGCVSLRKQVWNEWLERGVETDALVNLLHSVPEMLPHVSHELATRKLTRDQFETTLFSAVDQGIPLPAATKAIWGTYPKIIAEAENAFELSFSVQFLFNSKVGPNTSQREAILEALWKRKTLLVDLDVAVLCEAARYSNAFAEVVQTKLKQMQLRSLNRKNYLVDPIAQIVSAVKTLNNCCPKLAGFARQQVQMTFACEPDFGWNADTLTDLFSSEFGELAWATFNRVRRTPEQLYQAVCKPSPYREIALRLLCQEQRRDLLLEVVLEMPQYAGEVWEFLQLSDLSSAVLHRLLEIHSIQENQELMERIAEELIRRCLNAKQDKLDRTTQSCLSLILQHSNLHRESAARILLEQGTSSEHLLKICKFAGDELGQAARHQVGKQLPERHDASWESLKEFPEFWSLKWRTIDKALYSGYPPHAVRALISAPSANETTWKEFLRLKPRNEDLQSLIASSSPFQILAAIELLAGQPSNEDLAAIFRHCPNCESLVLKAFDFNSRSPDREDCVLTLVFPDDRGSILGFQVNGILCSQVEVLGEASVFGISRHEYFDCDWWYEAQTSALEATIWSEGNYCTEFVRKFELECNRAFLNPKYVGLVVTQFKHEAWVHVDVQLADRTVQSGFLTWLNSD